ncbi:pyrimidine 5'-nucleotidase [Pseudidiomarina aestuarii]|uniref:pyrimidine 5'-nucleotidase n=1 Tax=Pseudidiomarina aestuarii TaxID=624146 RepID=UPI003A9777E5
MIANYDWLLFDADDTLFHFDAFAGLRKMFQGYAVDFTRADYDTYQQLNKPLWDAYQAATIDAYTLQTRRFDAWAERLQVSSEQLNSRFLQTMADICEPLPGAKELVHAIKPHVNIGIITNGFTELQHVRLERTGFDAWVDVLVISEEVGIAKPHIDIFEHAFAQMEQPPRDRILMVGDNPHSDIQGGMNAGIHTCWLNHHGLPCPVGIEPHFEVSNLADLKQLLFAAEANQV